MLPPFDLLYSYYSLFPGCPKAAQQPIKLCPLQYIGVKACRDHHRPRNQDKENKDCRNQIESLHDIALALSHQA